MNDPFVILTDLAVIVFDLLLYSRLFALKKNTPLYRGLLVGGCGVILACYFLGVNLWAMPPATASAVFMTVPSFLLFLALSRHKGSRFVLTFCVVDTVSLIVAFLGRYVVILGTGSALWAFLVVAVLCAALLAAGWNRFPAYRVLLDTVDSGWGAMALASVLIYFALIFFTIYPKPLLQRVEYGLSWLVFAGVILACYWVFLQSVQKTRRIQEQNRELEREKDLFHLVYTDALTGLYNRAAYVERLKRREEQEAHTCFCCVMLDCNQFKRINDRFGHHGGDKALQRIADTLRTVFSHRTSDLFRIGGDEFAILLPSDDPQEIRALLAQLGRELEAAGAELEIPLSVAAGYAFTLPGEAVEEAFIRADARMYEDKKQG